MKNKTKVFFVTGTDTSVGKTVVTYLLSRRLQQEGFRVGIMKPFQCGGDDAAFLKKKLELEDDITDINPYFAKEPLSPHLAFQRQNMKINLSVLLDCFQRLCEEKDILFVEGAGGLMVPLKKNYYMIDLISDLNAHVIVVARTGLGTINHSLLTLQQLRQYALPIKGIIFNQSSRVKQGVAEKTNPDEVAEHGQVTVLGNIPYLRNVRTRKADDLVKETRRHIDIEIILEESKTLKAICRRRKRWDQEYLWHPFTQMQEWLMEDPLVIDRAQGSYLIDGMGRRYLDGVSSLWVNVHGHRHPVIDQMLQQQIKRLSHSTLLGLSNTPAIELARELVRITPVDLKKVFYSDNGSTAVEIAIKMAYQFWQNIGQKKKTGIAHLANSYHGDTLGGVSVSGIDLFHKVYQKIIFKTFQVDFPDCYRAPKGKSYPDYAFECLDQMDAFFKENARTLAAFVVEPIVQGAAGMIVWPQGVLMRMEEICRKHHVIFIVDEVATGFGRTGKMFACEHENAVPDILCVAKGLTGGYLPLAATITNQKIFDGFLFDYKDRKTFFHGHTYTGNPLCCAAALANIAVFKKEKVLQRLQPKIAYLEKRLKKFLNLKHVGDIRQKGFMVGIELVGNRQTKEPFPWERKIGARVCQAVRKKGVILRPLGNVIVLMPPLSISTQEIDQLLDSTYQAIQSETE